jgi:hypothetical protein
MAMEFEPLIKEMERVMMPELQRRREALACDSRFADVRVASLRHAEVVHTIGLTCHPIASSSPHDSYSIAVNIIAQSALMMRGFVTWSQPYLSVPVKSTPEDVRPSTYRNLCGYAIREGMTRPFYFRAGETAEHFVLLLAPLYSAFERGVRRGHPPGALRKLWNRFAFSET